MDVIDAMILNTDVAQHAVEVAEARGKAEGKAEGEIAQAVKVIQTLWRKKFGPLAQEDVAALDKLSLESFDHVLAQMLDPTYTITQARRDLGLANE